MGGAQGAGEMGPVRCGDHTWAQQLDSALAMPKGAMLSRKAVNAEPAQRSLGREIPGGCRADSRVPWTQPLLLEDTGRLMVALKCHNNTHLAGALTPLPSSIQTVCVFLYHRHPLPCPCFTGDHSLHAPGPAHLSPTFSCLERGHQRKEIQLKKKKKNQQHDRN